LAALTVTYALLPLALKLIAIALMWNFRSTKERNAHCA